MWDFFLLKPPQWPASAHDTPGRDLLRTHLCLPCTPIGQDRGKKRFLKFICLAEGHGSLCHIENDAFPGPHRIWKSGRSNPPRPLLNLVVNKLGCKQLL
ncbi:jg12036 [Pararge aegeria aegeria]|uniref:Jg12036 protein n=1 Tax=Pararge aegeria aegeria TaxID=348720 RepID=A0A8S4RTU5_9NEOP|nr:jg12036 [Pararge aegeria aegeria]